MISTSKKREKTFWKIIDFSLFSVNSEDDFEILIGNFEQWLSSGERKL